MLGRIVAGLVFASGVLLANAIVSFYIRNGIATVKLDDGTARLEWISSSSFRFARDWGEAATWLRPVAHDPVPVDTEERVGKFVMKTKHLVVEIDKQDSRIKVLAADGHTLLSEPAPPRKEQAKLVVERAIANGERFYGLGRDTGGALDLRGRSFVTTTAFLFSSAGYGQYFPGGAELRFDLGAARADWWRMERQGDSLEYFFYYGPSPKEILEQHLAVTGQSGDFDYHVLRVMRPAAVPREATRVPASPINSWQALRDHVRLLNQLSLSAVLYPAFDVSVYRSSDSELQRRTTELAALLPILYDSGGERRADPYTNMVRSRWGPYLVTYLREAYDRGYPLIRPLVIEFTRDPNVAQVADAFMLGDEVLVAPVVAPGTRRMLTLPMGLWTDLRTNVEYRGRTAVELDAPTDTIPLLVRNGSLIPLASDRAGGPMELHYFPKLGSEFFLWEPEQATISQFHASPAGEFVRLEIEGAVDRTYEWVVHHTGAAREVIDGDNKYDRVAERNLLRPGTWYHDRERNNLHVMVRAAAETDRIINISFQKAGEL